MASIRKEMALRADPAQVWDAVRDVGAIHTRLAPGFVTNVTLEGDARIVTFANGMSAKELIVTVDDDGAAASSGRWSEGRRHITTDRCRSSPRRAAAAWSGSPTSCRTSSPAHDRRHDAARHGRDEKKLEADASATPHRPNNAQTGWPPRAGHYLVAMTHYHVFETELGFCGIAWNDQRHDALPPARRQTARLPRRHVQRAKDAAIAAASISPRSLRRLSAISRASASTSRRSRSISPASIRSAAASIERCARSPSARPLPMASSQSAPARTSRKPHRTSASRWRAIRCR